MDENKFIQEVNITKEFVSRTSSELEERLRALDAKLDLYVSKNNLLKYLQANENQLKEVQRRVDNLGSLDLSKIVTNEVLDAVKNQFSAQIKQQPEKLISVIEDRVGNLQTEINKLAVTQINKQKLYEELGDIKSMLRGELQDYVTKDAFEGSLEGHRSTFDRQTGDLSKRIDIVSNSVPKDYVKPDALKAVRDEAIKISSQADRKVEVLQERLTKDIKEMVSFTSQELTKKNDKNIKQIQQTASDLSKISGEFNSIKEVTGDIQGIQQKIQSNKDIIDNIIVADENRNYDLWKATMDSHLMMRESQIDKWLQMSPDQMQMILDAAKKISTIEAQATTALDRYNKNLESVANQVNATKKKQDITSKIADELQKDLQGNQKYFLDLSKKLDEVRTTLEKSGINLLQNG